jgi:hypothetical protein
MELDFEKRHQQSMADLEQSLSTAQISPPPQDAQQLEPEPPVKSSAKPGDMVYKQTPLKTPSKQQRRRKKKHAEHQEPGCIRRIFG